MRRLVLSVSALALVGTALPVLASGDELALVQLPPGAGAFVSDNVEYLGTLPIAPSIGGRVLTVDGQQRLYTTGSQGLYVFDVTDPALPRPLGTYHLPHFQNEDVDVSDDGRRVIISTDTAGVDRGGSTANGIHVLDTSNLSNIRRVGFLNAGNHTTTCADAACNWLYGSSGRIYDATDPTSIKTLPTPWKPTGVSGGHALNRDESGLMISDTNPRLVLDVSNPAQPVELARGKASVKLPDGLLQHNNVRLGAEEWQPRAAGDDSPEIRPGEMFIGNSESNIRTQCGQNAGGLSSWSMVDFDKPAGEDEEQLRQLEVFRPINGSYANGDPAVNALGCSGHWFTVRDNMIAASWYEHGVRFIEVSPEGTFTQKGFFQPVVTEAGAAHWMVGPDGQEYVYSMDYARGIDILRFDRGGEVPSEEEFNASWLANLGKQGVAAVAERSLCRAAMQGHEAHVALP